MSKFSQAMAEHHRQLNAASDAFKKIMKPQSEGESTDGFGVALAKSIVSYIDALDSANSNNQNPLDLDHLDYLIVTDVHNYAIGSFIRGYRYDFRSDNPRNGWVQTSTILDVEFDVDHERKDVLGKVDYMIKTVNTNYGIIVCDDEDFLEELAGIEW